MYLKGRNQTEHSDLSFIRFIRHATTINHIIELFFFAINDISVADIYAIVCKIKLELHLQLSLQLSWS